jgi:hypothetical protein
MSRLLTEEISNRTSDFLVMGFEREVAGVVKADLGARVVALDYPGLGKRLAGPK